MRNSVRLALALTAPLLVAAPTFGWASLGSPQWAQGNIVMQIQVDMTAPSQPLLDGSTTWGQVVTGALADWNGYLTVSHFTWVLNSTAPANSDAQTSNGYNNVRWGTTIYGESWGSSGGDVAGIALTWYSNDQMTEGDVLFNSGPGVKWDSYRGNLRYDGSGNSINDLKRIALHEFGHVLGLDHPDQHNQSVAAIMNSVESNTDDLTADDIAGGQNFYAAVLAPVITQQPIASQSVALGGSTSAFAVYTHGTPPFSYQWYRNGTALTGSALFRSWAFALTGITAADAGTYTVVVSNSAATVTSSGSVLSIAGSAPVITTNPTSQTVAAGGNVTFSVAATGAAPLSYQWNKGGLAITGGTASTYTLANVQSTDAGSYTVTVSNGSGSATSSSATLTVTAAAPTIQTQPAAQTVNAGSAASFSVTAVGTSPLSYQWKKDGALIPGATTASYSIASAAATDAGDYSVSITNVVGVATSNTAILTVATGPSAWLTNLSVRTNLGAGQTLIVGFAATGGVENLLVRAVGPGLAAVLPQLFSASAVMADPRLALYPNGATTPSYTNDNWDASLASTFTSVSAFPLPNGSLDAAFVQPIHGGSNSVFVQGTGPGIVLVEAYALGTLSSPRLINLSARNQVGTGSDVLIAGFVISGSGTKKLLIRGVGPGLAPFGVNDALVDPQLEIYAAGAATPMATNDNWDASLTSIFDSVGAFRLSAGSTDAAMVITLPAGGYTAELKGANGGTGEGLVEIYEIQ